MIVDVDYRNMKGIEIAGEGNFPSCVGGVVVLRF